MHMHHSNGAAATGMNLHETGPRYRKGTGAHIKTVQKVIGRRLTIDSKTVKREILKILFQSTE